MRKKKSYPINFIQKIIENDLLNENITIRTRFPPEPNGYLHIGHAKSICLNFGLAEDYNGQCNLRFDDTNPEKENIEYVKSIKKDIRWLGFKWFGNVCYSSNYFDEIHNYAVELINKGLAYVDELSPSQIRKYRGTLTLPGRNSPYRNRSIKDNIELFRKMREGKIEEEKACLRAKINMKSQFIVMRDPVLYRVKFVKHHQTGNKWCIYPTYDFCHCISDAIEKISHSLCTMEFQENRNLYNWILKNITISSRPRQYEFSRLNLEYTVMSKRKLSLLVSKNYVEGWDDPRMPTISGLRRRGYTSVSIREFCKQVGVTRKNNIIKMSLLESCIRKDLNEIAFRVMVVINPIKLIIENYPKNNVEIILMPNHPKKPQMGFRKVPFSNEIWIDRSDFREKGTKEYKRLILGKEVRLRNSYVIKAEKVKKDAHNNVTAIYCTYSSDTLNKNPTDGRKIKGVIHWISLRHALPIEVRLYDYLFTIPNIKGTENIFSVFNHKSLTIKQSYAEPSLKDAIMKKSYQFEREGYFCLDHYHTNYTKLVFNRIVKLKENLKKT